MGMSEFLVERYGGGFAFFYCFFVFMMTIGFFNVISAIFVERTMDAAASLQLAKANQRLHDNVLWSTEMAKLIKVTMDVSSKGSASSSAVTGKLSDSAHEISQMVVT